jgi:hypothetical protein
MGPYDLVIADPPSFQKGSFVATKDWARLLRRLPDLLREGVGLSNTRARLAQALGAQARLELCNRPAPDQGCWARIVIPLPGNAPSSTHSMAHPNAHPVSS